ncbi:putative X8 domain-containing protein [Medicago truncatula]|uniref:Putative X8 domain-containing protein n=1 Tax=Medicago truncatula TaxID=3880 RepID=A0A396GUT6_MEDTR|nr:putative X8 domain-containing protein [Medicago truncatula]
MATSKLISVMLMLTFATTIILINVVIVGGKKTWCVSRSEAGTQQLLDALNYACGAGADCGPIQPGGSCYYPNTLQNHASYAFNSYYQKARGSCDFVGSAHIVFNDPSFGQCVYPSS